MKKISKFVTIAFYLQILLLVITGIIFIKTRNANDFSGLYVIYGGVPALFLSPIILISSIIVIIKQHKVALPIWFALCANVAIGAYFYYLAYVVH